MTLVETDKLKLGRKEVELLSPPIVVHTFEDYVSVLAGQMEISSDDLYGRKGDGEDRGFLDKELVISPHQLTHLVRMREDAPNVVLQIVENLTLTGFRQRVPTGFEISAKANSKLDIEEARRLLKREVKGETWVDFHTDRMVAAQILAEAAKLRVVNTSHFVPDALKHTGVIAQWQEENLTDEARRALGAPVPMRDKDRLKIIGRGAAALGFVSACMLPSTLNSINGINGDNNSQPESTTISSGGKNPDSSSGTVIAPAPPGTPNFESIVPAPDFFTNSAINGKFTRSTTVLADPSIESKILAAESRMGATGLGTQTTLMTDEDGDQEFRIMVTSGDKSYFYSDVIYDEQSGELRYVPPGKGEAGSEHGILIPIRAYQDANGDNVIGLAHEFTNPNTNEAGWIVPVELYRYRVDENGNLTNVIFTDPYSRIRQVIGGLPQGINVQPTPSPNPTEVAPGLLDTLQGLFVQHVEAAQPTPTPEPTVAPTPSVPAEFGVIQLVEEYQGKQYAIDASGIAVAVQNEKGEWEKFNRLAKLAFSQRVNVNGISVDVSRELEGNQIQRLVDNEGGLVPFGYLFEYKPYEDKDNFTHVFVSGYVRGVYLSPTEDNEYQIVFEVPSSRYERQILVFRMKSTDKTHSNVWKIPNSRNIEEANIILDAAQNKKIFTDRSQIIVNGTGDNMSFTDVIQALSKESAVGQQIVLSFQSQSHLDYVGDNQYIIAANNFALSLREAVRESKALEGVDASLFPSFIWIPESLTK